MHIGIASAATTLFDPERGESGPVDPVADSRAGHPGGAERSRGGSMPKLRLDGILVLGDSHRVMISGPKGERFRFTWRGDLKGPLPFEGDAADTLKDYSLVSAGERSVWLSHPAGTTCQPLPEEGISACRDGKVQLSLVRRAPSPPQPAPMAQAPVGPGPAGGPVKTVRINPFTGKPLQMQPPVAAGARTPSQKRVLLGKSKAQLRAEALKREYRENNRRALQAKKDAGQQDLPPGFKASASLFGKSMAVESNTVTKPPEAKAPTAADRVKALKEKYRQRSLNQLQEGYTGSFGFGPRTK